MRKLQRNILFVLLTVIFTTIFIITASAATPGTGYTVDKAKNQTNIKWTMTADGTLTFEIDPAATDKISSTSISNIDPVTHDWAAWNKALPTYAEAVKIIIGDGITEFGGFTAMKNLKSIELPTSLTSISNLGVESSSSLESIYVRGTEHEAGTFDLRYITSFYAHCFDGIGKMTKIILNPSLNGELPVEFVKDTGLTELEIPAGVTLLKDKSIVTNKKLKTLTILGMDTQFESDAVFGTSATFPAIKAYAGSKAEEFAKANGYTFINIETGEEIKGTKPAPSESSGNSNTDSTAGSTYVPVPVTPPAEFDHTGATAWGHMSGEYKGSPVVDTYWAYYDDTKTLELTSLKTTYNESGSLTYCDEGSSWEDYKLQIEHVIVGDNIGKISFKAFIGHTALKDVRIGKQVTRIDWGAFSGCTAFSTLWRDGNERTEGVVDLTGITNGIQKETYDGTAVLDIILDPAIKSIDVTLPVTLRTLYTSNMTDALITYAKENLYDLVDPENENNAYRNYVYLDPLLTKCGDRAVFDFDEATGTLTIIGVGAIQDTINYYGGGSKNSPWFSIKQKIKHVIIDERITSIGKYAFTQCQNLETVCIPNTESFSIGNAAFEKCTNLRSIYRAGTAPIEGTLDLGNVGAIESWTFAYDYLIANVIVNDKVDNIGSSVFEENINLQNIYGVPGSYAEAYASENGLDFYDSANSNPVPRKCTIPETSAAETTTAAQDTAAATESETDAFAATESEMVTERETTGSLFVDVTGIQNNSSGNTAYIIIAIAAASAVTIAIIVIFILKKIKNRQ